MDQNYKALIFCSDKIPCSDNATSGGGIRSLQILQILSDLGIVVSFVTPENSGQKSSTLEFNFLGEYNLNNQHEFASIDSFNIIYWCNPGTIDVSLAANTSWVSLVDFHGPNNLETIHVTHESLQVATQRISKGIAQCDAFTYVNEVQRAYWLGLLTASGIDPSRSYGPILNLASKQTQPIYSINQRVKFVFPGGWHPWLMDEQLFLSIAEAIESLENSTFHILGGAHNYCKSEYDDLLSKLKSFNNTKIEGYLSHDKYIKFITNSSCILDIFSKTYERQISISTRSFEAINLGVPLIHPSWTQLSSKIEEYKCGYIYDNFNDLKDCLMSIDENPSVLNEYSSKSESLSKDIFNYDKSVYVMLEIFRYFQFYK